jgi:hypothetical protein
MFENDCKGELRAVLKHAISGLIVIDSITSRKRGLGINIITYG